MKSSSESIAATTQIHAGIPAITPVSDDAAAQQWLHAKPTIRDRAARFWLRFLMTVTETAPWVAQASRPFWVIATWICSPTLRALTTANARWLLGPTSTMAQRRRLGRRVIDQFYRFIFDVAASSRMSPAQLLQLIENTQGQEHYEAARKLGRGVIVATAHMGSYEVAMASLRAHENKPIHVLYFTDRLDQFQRVRKTLHDILKINEIGLDHGWETWMQLRDALQRDEVVVMQVDRLMPGQKGLPVPFCGGHISLPTGPLRLAMLTGAPIVPVFSIRQPNGKIRLVIEPAIMVPADVNMKSEQPPEPLLALAAIIEKHILAHPQQWLMLFRVWREDDEAQR